MRNTLTIAAWLMLMGACTSATPPRDGECHADGAHRLECGDEYDAYLCTGSARPDDAPKYIEGVPQGTVCADAGDGYCCTKRTTSCAFNPVASCDEGSYGFQCRGASRPDSLNANLHCGNGVIDGDDLDFCCSGSTLQPGCLQTDAVGCSSRLTGFTCTGDDLPRAEQLGASKSRADDYRLLCSAPMPAANPAYNNYCCFTPAPLPVGGSCVQHTKVPGCDAGRFGFACYGPEHPQDDYAPMHCPEPGVPGVSAEGYPATLYCCDFM